MCFDGPGGSDDVCEVVVPWTLSQYGIDPSKPAKAPWSSPSYDPIRNFFALSSPRDGVRGDSLQTGKVTKRKRKKTKVHSPVDGSASEDEDEEVIELMCDAALTPESVPKEAREERYTSKDSPWPSVISINHVCHEGRKNLPLLPTARDGLVYCQ